jgi:hypothetical protein
VRAGPANRQHSGHSHRDHDDAGSSQTIDEIRKLYHVHAGPLYLNPGLLLKELGVDTNVFNQPGDQKSDFTFTVTPKADIALPFARRGLLRHDGVRRCRLLRELRVGAFARPQVTLRGEAYAQRLTLFAQGAYLNTRQRPNYEIDLRSRHVETDGSAGLALRLTPKFSVELAAHTESIRYDADQFFLGTSLQTTLNRDTTGVQRDRSRAAVGADDRRGAVRELPRPVSAVAGAERRQLPGDAGRGVQAAALISGSAYVGYRSFSPKSALLPAYDGLVSQLGLAYTLQSATTFGVTYDRDIDYSFEAVNPYFLENSVGVYVRRAVGGRFDVIVNAARHRYDYRDNPVLAGLSDPRVDTTDNYGANLGYRLKRDTRIGFGASYYTRTSTRETFREYDGLRVVTTVNYGF